MKEGWKEYKFSEIADFPPKVKLEKGKEYPFVLMDEVDAGFKYVRASFKKSYNGSGAKFENGDTLFARITPSLENGKIAQIQGINKPAFGSTEFFVFRGKENISDNDFIYYLSKTDWFRQNAVNSMVGASGRQRADAKFVGKTKLLVPPLPTQRKIAKILSAYDDLIENNLKRIKLLEEMAQKTYEEWFIRFKFPGHETAKFDMETGLPEGWKYVKLGEEIEILSSKRIFLSEYVSNGIPFYRGKEITLKSKNNSLSDVLFISEKRYNQIKAKFGVPQNGDILITAVGTIGSSYLVTESDGDFYFKDGNLIWLKGNENISSKYLISFFKNKHFKKLLNNIAIGSSQKAITRNGKSHTILQFAQANAQPVAEWINIWEIKK